MLDLLFPPSGPEEDLCLHEVRPLPPTASVFKDGCMGQQVGLREGKCLQGASAVFCAGVLENSWTSLFPGTSCFLLFSLWKLPPSLIGPLYLVQ